MKALEKAGVVDAGRAGVRLPARGHRDVPARGRARASRRRSTPEDVRARGLRQDARSRSSSATARRPCSRATRIDRDGLRREVALLGDSIVIAGGAVAGPPPHPHQRAGEALRGRGAVRRRRADEGRGHARAARVALRPEPGGARRASSPTRPATCRRRCSRSSASASCRPRLLRLGELPRQGHDHAGRVLRALRRDRRGAQDLAAAARGLHAGLRERRARTPASIVSVHLSAGLSGTYQAAVVGARPVQKTKIEHVDSRNVYRRPGPRRARGRRGRGGRQERRRGRATIARERGRPRADLRGRADADAPRARRPRLAAARGSSRSCSACCRS